MGLAKCKPELLADQLDLIVLALGAYFGGNEKKKNILVYLCSRPAQGGGAGLLRYYHQKTAPEPPLPYFGGSTSKIKLRQNRHYLYY